MSIEYKIMFQNLEHSLTAIFAEFPPLVKHLLQISTIALILIIIKRLAKRNFNNMEKTSPISENELKKLDTLDTTEGTSSSLNTSASEEHGVGAAVAEDPAEFSEEELKKAEEFKT